jgi:heme oxygenase (biliverdin-IX-beta and delta-forming)
LPDIRRRRKASFLLDDLACLGFSTDQLPLSNFLPMIESEPEAWGALYVLEGSTPGGRGITKMLLKQCPTLTLHDIKFFNGYSDETGPMWVRFQKALNGLPYHTDEIAVVIRPAKEAVRSHIQG